MNSFPNRGNFLPNSFSVNRAIVAGLSPAAWYQFGVGITSAGGLVSAWADQSGKGRNLVQAVGSNQPTLDTDNSILFDGVDNFLAVNFTLNQPETVYALVKQVTWTSADRILDGQTNIGGTLTQSGASPIFFPFAGSSAGNNGNLAVGAFGAIAIVFNGASSLSQVGTTTPVTGNAGANNMGGLTLGAAGGGIASWGNVAFKEVIVYPTAHDAATRARVICYLSQVGQL